MRRLSVLLLLSTLAAHGKEDGKGTPAPSTDPGRSVEAPSLSGSARPDAHPRPPLAPLPRPPTLEVPPPTTAAMATLDSLLGRLVAKDAVVRDSAVGEVLEVEADLLPAIRRRLQSIAESSSTERKEAMKELLGQIRDRTREELREKARAEGREEKTKTPDYLVMLEARPKPDQRPWVDLVSVVAMSRMLRQIGTVSATRELIGIYARFGEFLRVDTQLGLEALGDRAVAALIEAQRHPAPKVASWAARQLDALGKAIPGEAVQTQDPEALADILRAYGRVRDPDAARLVISFANSERTQIRDAARQAVVLMGEVANWQLRDTYENVVGRKPPREWSWERSARELFGEFDRLRLSEVFEIFERGLGAEKAGKLEEAISIYDQVLAHSPNFERGAEMAPGYLAYANARLDSDRAKAALALRRVARLAPEGSGEARRAQSLLVTLEAEDLLARHIADVALLQKATGLDPDNRRAARLLADIEATDAAREQRVTRIRYAAAGSLGAIALVGALLILLRRKSTPEVAPSSAVHPEASPNTLQTRQADPLATPPENTPRTPVRGQPPVRVAPSAAVPVEPTEQPAGGSTASVRSVPPADSVPATVRSQGEPAVVPHGPGTEHAVEPALASAPRGDAPAPAGDAPTPEPTLELSTVASVASLAEPREDHKTTSDRPPEKEGDPKLH